MRKKTLHKQGHSLRTLLIYSLLVFLVISASLLIKFFFIVRSSRFDGEHHFTVYFTQGNKVKEIYISNPDTSSQVVLLLDGKGISLKSINKTLLILPDASVGISSDMRTGPNISQLFYSVIWHYPVIQTNMTIYDAIRLYLLSSSIPPANTTVQSLTEPYIPLQSNLVADNSISSENVPIQIINATDVSGLGALLAQILEAMGANIVEVSTSPSTESSSNIQYYGEQTYTLQKISRLLGYPVSRVYSQPIANIVIILGEKKDALLND